MDAEKIGAHLRHVSFYSPLVTAEPVQKVHQALSSIRESPSNKIPEKTKKNGDEGEIGIFSAEKYFSMKLDDTDSAQNDAFPGRYEQESREDPPWMRSRSRPGTPSVRSESSYNSQTFLLRSSLKNSHNRTHTKQRKANETSVSFGGFRCSGPCSGGKSVNTNRKTHSHTRKSGHNSVTCDARRHLDKPRLPVEARKANRVSETQDLFPVPVQKADIAMNLERKLSMLTWDAIPNAPNYLAAKNKNSNSSIGSKTHEDTASDASSDLFEIENINCGIYEPSEASIDWSVVTGSMADHSMISDIDEKRLSDNRKRSTIPVAKTKSAIEKERSGGILSGCKSYKAVTVVESVYRNEKQAKVHQQPRRKFQTEVRIQDLDFL